MIRTEEGAVPVVSFDAIDDATALHRAIESLRANPRVKAIVVRVEPFVGLERDALRAMKLASDGEAAARALAKRIRAIGEGTKPVVAWIEEEAIGAAFELALACTASVATERARVGLPAVTLGLIPPANGLLRVSQRAGIAYAIELAISGRSVSADEACAKGLVDEVGALEAAKRLAELLAVRPKLRETLPRTRARRGRTLADLAIESTPVGRAVLLERKRRALSNVRGAGTEKRILDVLSRFSLRGFTAGAETEAKVFGELVVSESSQRLRELAVAEEATRAPKEIAPIEHIEIADEVAGKDLAEKRAAIAELEARVSPSCVIASSSHVIPIAQIALGAKHPGRIVGMRQLGSLVEIVAPVGVDPSALAKAESLARSQNRAVIVVKDTPGFYTSRILVPYLAEALRLVAEGETIEAVDRSLLDWGFAQGPSKTIDDLGLDVVTRIASVLEASLGPRLAPPSADHRGRKDPKRTMPEDSSLRCSLAMINEAMYCLGEGVVASASEGDVGAVLGLGFPAFRGGPFRFVDVIGPADVLRRVRSLEHRFGARFEPAPLLVDMARTGRRFYS